MSASKSSDQPDMRTRLVNAALELFQTKGYQGTSLAEIASAAEATKGAFYHYFQSKDDLLVALHIEYLERQLESLTTICDRGGPADARLRAVVHAMVMGVYDYPAHVTLFVEERRSIAPDTARKAYRLRGQFEARLVELVEEGVADGTLRGDVTPTVAVRGLIGMLTWTFTWTPRKSRAAVDAIAAELTTVALSGLGAPSA